MDIAIARGRAPREYAALVGRVLRREITAPLKGRAAIIRYRLRLLWSSGAHLKRGQIVVLQGARLGAQEATARVDIPLIARGCIVFFDGVSSTRSGAFHFERIPGLGPLGIPNAAPVSARRVPLLVKALAEYSHLERHGGLRAAAAGPSWNTSLGSQLPLSQQRKLRAGAGKAYGFLGSRNYYLFSLGAWILARYGTRSDLENLEAILQVAYPRQVLPKKNLANWRNGKPAGLFQIGRKLPPLLLSERRALLLVYCLRNVTPVKRRLPAEDVDVGLDVYTRKVLAPQSSKFLR